MAVNNRRRRRRIDLPDDIIIEIMTRLPLKDAARCRILNKYFYNTISTPRFVLDHHALLSPPSSSCNSIILHQSLTSFTRMINSGVPKSITHTERVRIIDSCNGIFLLSSKYRDLSYLFNPFTSGVRLLKCNIPITLLYCGALVVDNINPSSSDIKLVELQTKTMGYEFWRGVCPAGVLRFRVFVLVPESKKASVLMKESFRFDYEGSFDPLIDLRRRPVYAHGCVHWLGVGATAIAAFDVQSLRARIMDGPVTHAVDCTTFRIWFGLAQGSLQFIHTDDTDDTTTVHTHNYITHEWRVAHKIHMQMMMIPADMKKKIPMFFDGLNVFFHISKLGNNIIQEIYVHDLSTGVWRKIGQVGEKIARYLEFVPTTAWVSDSNLSKMPAHLGEICLLGLLRQLLLD